MQISDESDMEADIQLLAKLLREARHQNFDNYVQKWMELLPGDVRKRWSYVGGLFSRRENDPVDELAEQSEDYGVWHDSGDRPQAPDTSLA